MTFKIDKGKMAATAAPFFIALSIIVTKIAGHTTHPLVVAALASVISVPFLLSVQLLRKESLGLSKIITQFPAPFLKVLFATVLCPQEIFHVSANSFWLIASYSVTFFVIASSLYFYAFKTIKPWIIASFLSLEVVFGLLLAMVLLQETITPLQLAGAIVVVLATIGIGRSG